MNKKIKKNKKIIRFTSEYPYYEYESNDIKNNTIRNTSDWDYDRWENFILATHIKIVENTMQKEIQFFIREIKHKCLWNGFAIITWKELKGEK